MRARYKTQSQILDRINFFLDLQRLVDKDPEAWRNFYVRKPNIPGQLKKLKDKLAEFRTGFFPALANGDFSVQKADSVRGLSKVLGVEKSPYPDWVSEQLELNKPPKAA